MKSYAVSVFVFIMISVILISCQNTDKDKNTSLPVLSDNAKKAADLLLSYTEINASSNVFVSGPVEAKTILKEDKPEELGPVKLVLPEATGEYYVFFIDDYPGAGFEHNVRFAYVDINRSSFDVIEASYYMFIDRPSEESEPFKLTASENINETPFYFLEGEGGADATLSEDTKPSVSAEINQSTFNTPLRSDGNCKKYAFVMDLGEKKRSWSEIASDVWHEKELIQFAVLSDDFARDADGLYDYVTSNGFEGERVSQYWGNSHPQFTSAVNKASVAGQLLTHIRDMKFLFQDTNECCNELFLGFVGHGTDTGDLWISTSKGDVSYLPYASLMEALNEFPKNVKITLFLSSCFSGMVMNHIGTFCEEHDCGLTVLTATDANNYSDAGSPITHSYVQYFLYEDDYSGDDVFTEILFFNDPDDDGDERDLKDRFYHMRQHSDWFTGKPTSQFFHCPDQEKGDWCSLDNLRGCKDPNAENYNPDVDEHVQKMCKYKTAVIEGCTDSQAVNYNPEAVVDDQSCIYSTESSDSASSSSISNQVIITDTKLELGFFHPEPNPGYSFLEYHFTYKSSNDDGMRIVVKVNNEAVFEGVVQSDGTIMKEEKIYAYGSYTVSVEIYDTLNSSQPLEVISDTIIVDSSTDKSLS